MAGGLDDLIEFLLEETALGGESGLTFRQYALLVQQFYRRVPVSSDVDEHANINNDSDQSLKGRAFDWPLLSKTWTWLARHPDVSIGKDRQYNHETLDELERLFPGYTSLSSVNDVTAKEALSSEEDISGPHLFVNNERISIAICGHRPDPTRVFPSEWVLLQCIAASRAEGIMQGDLVRASKQDKRSVPKRTDLLHEKGYIVKRVLYLRGNKTSRLYLHRFADVKKTDEHSTLSVIDQPTVAHTARQMFDLLKNSPLISYDILSDALGMKRKGRARILAQLIRHFVRLGCLRRIKTAIEPSAQSNDLKLCIELIREPTHEEWQASSVQSIDLNQPVEVLASLYEAEAEQSNVASAEDDNILDSSGPIESLDMDDDMTGYSRQIVPQWNPDRVLTNVLFQIAQEKGSSGLSNSDAKNLITGPFIRRTIESLLVRISNRSLLAQPMELRHLAIIRTQQFPTGILNYIHYTFESYAEKVVNGEMKWKDIVGGEQYLDELKLVGKDVVHTKHCAELDEFGFVRRSEPNLQMNNGEASMSQLLRDANANGIHSGLGDIALKDLGGGRLKVVFQEKTEPTEVVTTPPKPTKPPLRGRPPRQISKQAVERPTEAVVEPRTDVRANIFTTPLEIPRAKPQETGTSTQTTRGRPRKFTRGTEQYWRDMFPFIIEEKDPVVAGRQAKTGVMANRAALEVFNHRPPGFDETVIKAMDLGLPVAAQVCDISVVWMDKIKAVMQRAQAGLHITPAGYQAKTRKRWAQTLILRSDRLHEVDWADRQKCLDLQNISHGTIHSPSHQGISSQGDVSPHEISGITQPQVEPDAVINDEDSVAVTPPIVLPVDLGTLQTEGSLHEDSIDEEVLPSSWSVFEDKISAPRVQTEMKTSDLIETRDPHIESAEQGSMQDEEASVRVSSPSSADQSGSTKSARPTRKKKLTRKAAESSLLSDVGPIDAESTVVSQPDQAIVVEIDGHGESSLLKSKDQPPRLQQSTTNSMPGTDSASSADHQTGTDETNIGLDSPPISHTKIQPPTRGEQVHDPRLFDPLTPGLPVQAFALESLQPNGFASAENLTLLPDATVVHTETLPRSSLSGELETTVLDRGRSNYPDIPDWNVHVPSGQTPSGEHTSSEATRQAMTEIEAEKTSQDRKRPRPDGEGPPEIVEVGEQTTSGAARKRLKEDGTYEITRSEVSGLCRKMVLELIGLSSGLAPNVPWTFRRAMVPRWQEAGITMDQLSAKNIRAAIKSLCGSGKLKSIMFAFRGKSGIMVKMSVIALSGMDAQHPAVLDIQERMRELEPADYIPPELEAESRRKPNRLNVTRYKKEFHADPGEETVVQQPKTSRSSRRQQNKGQKSTDSTETIRSVQQASIQDASPPSVVPPNPAANVAQLERPGLITLKIPRFRELGLPTETSFQLDPQRHVLPRPGQASHEPVTDKIEPRVARRTRARRKGSPHFDPETHKLIWKNQKKLGLPSSIEEVPNIKLCRNEATLAAKGDTIFARFEAEVDCVAAWETMLSDAVDARTGPLKLINHTFTGTVHNLDRTPEQVQFGVLVQFDATGKAVETKFPETESWEPFTFTSLHQEPMVAQPEPDATSRRTRKPSKRTIDTAMDPDDEDYVLPLSRRQQRDRGPKRPRRSIRTALDSEVDNADPFSKAPVRHTRLRQLLRTMTEEVRYQIVVAVLIVRTLAGGIEKFTDWRIVCRLVTTYEEDSIRDAWKTILNRYRLDIAEMTTSLQYTYVEALNDDQVPTVNFDDIHATDWQGIYQWALTNLDRSIVKNAEELPATRTGLLQRDNYSMNESKAVRELFCYNAPQTIPRKEEVLSSLVFSKPLRTKNMNMMSLVMKSQTEEEEADIDLSRARSWVMATMLASDDSLVIEKAYSKLLTLASTRDEVEKLVERAIKCLQREKLIIKSQRIMPVNGQKSSRSRENRDQNFNPMRYYEASAKFFEHFDFRRLITTAMLKRAVRYKLEVLDPAFRQQGASITIAKDTILDDGEMVAILNLVATDLIRIHPGSDVPASMWGLDWQNHGYTTRMIEKKSLGFGVVLSPKSSNGYTFDDPLSRIRSITSIPRGEIDFPNGQGRIPMWFDIAHSFQSSIWEMVLGAIIGLVSVRPGIDARELARTLWYGISLWEVELVLQWSEKVGVIKTTTQRVSGTADDNDNEENEGEKANLKGARWETTQWWWMVMGSAGSHNANDLPWHNEQPQPQPPQH